MTSYLAFQRCAKMDCTQQTQSELLFLVSVWLRWCARCSCTRFWYKKARWNQHCHSQGCFPGGYSFVCYFAELCVTLGQTKGLMRDEGEEQNNLFSFPDNSLENVLDADAHAKENWDLTGVPSAAAIDMQSFLRAASWRFWTSVVFKT